MKNASSYCVPLRNWFSLVALLCLGVACGSETDDDGGTPDGSCQPGDNKDGDAFVCAPYGDDCDDTDPSINPDAVEIPYDGIDQDCDTVDEVDLDQDGHDAEQVGGMTATTGTIWSTKGLKRARRIPSAPVSWVVTAWTTTVMEK